MNRLGSVLTAFEAVGLAIGIAAAPVGAIVTVAAYVLVASQFAGYRPHLIAVGVGLVLAAAAGWLLVAAYRRVAQDPKAYPEEYNALLERSTSASKMLSAVACDAALLSNLYGPHAPADRPIAAARVAQQEARSFSDELMAALASKDEQWLAGTPYLIAWNRLYRLEEALICCAPADYVVAGAINDLDRLGGSEIDHRDILSQQLKRAVVQVSPTAGQQLDPPVAAPAAGAAEPAEARAMLRQVRRAIDDYRAEQWSGLIRSRNILMLAAALAGLAAYVLLVIVVLAPAPPSVAEAAVAFFLVGAVVALSHQTYLQITAQGVVEDFGLSVARVLASTQIAGLTAVLAIAIFAAIGIKVNDVTILAKFSDWRHAFSWSTDMQAVFVAALFGFAPSLLFQALQQQASQLQQKLTSSGPSGKAAAS
jgi:hypothetical protein